MDEFNQYLDWEEATLEDEILSLKMWYILNQETKRMAEDKF